jgi:ribosome biogenesis GTPase / thiamine phosphate phosphatase
MSEAGSSERGELTGRVTLVHGITAEVVWTEAQQTHTRMFPLGLKLNMTPVAGDWVALDPESGIRRVLERRTALRRPSADGKDQQVLAANIDLIMIVLSVEGGFNSKALERFSVMAWDSGAEQMVVLSKADLADDLDDSRAAAEAAVPGADLVITSAFDGRGLEQLRARVPAGVSATMFGPSGAGKTSLLNALEGRHEQVRAVSRDGGGRHTTTNRRLYTLQNGGVLLDLPGIRNLDVIASQEAIDETFSDITELASDCRFGDCAHEHEPGCAVRAAVAAGELGQDRLERWRELRREASYHDRDGDPAKEAAKRAEWKQLNKTAKRKRQDR